MATSRVGDERHRKVQMDTGKGTPLDYSVGRASNISQEIFDIKTQFMPPLTESLSFVLSFVQSLFKLQHSSLQQTVFAIHSFYLCAIKLEQ